MAKKVTLSIPDELVKFMEPWKNSLKLSEILQNGILRAITAKEVRQKRLEEGGIDMEEAIKRLREEKMEPKKEIEEDGREEGFSWATTAHYEELQIVVNSVGSEIPIRELAAFSEDCFRDYLHEILTDQGMNVNSEDYYFWETGWVKGVRDFWDEVKDKI